MNKEKLVTYFKTFCGDAFTPISLFQNYVGEEIGFLLESKGKGKYSFIAKNPYDIIKGKGNLLTTLGENLRSFEINNTTNLPFVGGAVGALAYEVVEQNINISFKNKDIIQTPDINFMVIKDLIVYDHFHDSITLVILDQDNEEGKEKASKKIEIMEKEIFSSNKKINNQFSNKTIKFKPNISKEDFIKTVIKSKDYIDKGEITQVVLSQRLTAHTDEDSFQIYRKLRMINPSPYLFYFNFGAYQVAGSSPEMLTEVRGEKIFTSPIAGTRKRGKDAAEDERLAVELKNDIKELNEHMMLIDSSKEDMAKVANADSVNVIKELAVERFSHVMHLVSTVEGVKKEDAEPISIISAFLPAGTLSGAPKQRAMEIIEELETERRGLYGGAIGYFSFSGDMDFCITIRTIIIKDKEVYIQAGAGIVKESVPEKEYDECFNKLRATAKAIGGEI